MIQLKYTCILFFLVNGFTFASPTLMVNEGEIMISGCLDQNAINYNPLATVQEEDEWGNALCTYLSCNDAPYDGCMYTEAYSPWYEWFTPTDCSNFGGTPCFLALPCDSCAYNEVCNGSVCEQISTVSSDLPVVYINTENQELINSTDVYVLGTVTVESGFSVKGDSLLSGLDSLSMKIRGRGNSTWVTHPKKPYQMKLDDKAEFLGMPNDKKWLFLAEHSDKTMLRNAIALEMGYASTLDWTPLGEFAEVYINGLYNGTYFITQKVEEKSNRVDIGNEGFLLEIDQLERLDEDDHYVSSNQFPVINVKEPNINDIIEDDGIFSADSTLAVIDNFINEFENVLFNPIFTDPINGYAKYIDVESFIDWFLINEISKNVDSKSYSSIYFNVILDGANNGKIKMGPLWDFDLSFGNNDYSDCEFTDGWWVRNNPWISRLFQDPVFQNQVKVRFDEHFYARKDTLLNAITNFSNTLLPSAVENDITWAPYLGTYVWPNPFQADVSSGNSGQQGYTEAVTYMKDWYSQRMEWLRINLGTSSALLGCLDANAINYNPNATAQAQDQWNNALCTYASCNDVPTDGCMYTNAFAAFNTNFNADDCSSYAGTPCLDVPEPPTTSQELNLPEGWSMFSTYMLAENMSLEAVLEPIVENVVIVKDYLGAAYLPEYNFNTIGAVELGLAYFIKLTNAEDLSIQGTYQNPEEYAIALNQGWSLLGYLRLEPADAAAVLADVHNSSTVIVAKDYSGNAYLPEWEFNNIGDFEPGQGYHLKLSNEGTLSYLSNDDFYRTSMIEPLENNLAHFPKAPIQANNMTFVIEDHSWDIVPQEGAEIAAYDRSGSLVGSAIYTSPVSVLTVWGDDELTAPKDGLENAELSSFKVWSNHQTHTFEIVKWDQGSAYYSVNAINVASSIVTNNPRVILTAKQPIWLKTVNMLGQEVSLADSFKGQVLFKIFSNGTVQKIVK